MQREMKPAPTLLTDLPAELIAAAAMRAGWSDAASMRACCVRLSAALVPSSAWMCSEAARSCGCPSARFCTWLPAAFAERRPPVGWVAWRYAPTSGGFAVIHIEAKLAKKVARGGDGDTSEAEHPPRWRRRWAEDGTRRRALAPEGRVDRGRAKPNNFRALTWDPASRSWDAVAGRLAGYRRTASGVRLAFSQARRRRMAASGQSTMWALPSRGGAWITTSGGDACEPSKRTLPASFDLLCGGGVVFASPPPYELPLVRLSATMGGSPLQAKINK
jgi:hypothetical protein